MKRKNTRVPAEFQSLLQSAPIDEWDVDEDKLYIIESFLNKGTISSLRWLWQTYPEIEIKQRFKTLRDMNEKTARFWSTYFDIPETEVRCLDPAYQRMRKLHWPY